MSQAPRYIPKYTVADYEQWEGDWELWDGVPVAMSPAPTFRHQQIVGRLITAFNQALSADDECPCEAVSEVDWHIADTTVVRPDLVVVCQTPPDDFLTDAPELVVEVLSPSTAAKDRIQKRDLYASQSVPFYLIVDHENASIEVLRLSGKTYISRKEAELRLHENCRVEIDLAEVFAR